MDNWEFDESKLGEKEKRILLSQLIKITTLVIMNSTCYSFGGVIYLQRAGAGIGLRGSAVLARLVMSIWDKILATLFRGWNFRGKLYVRYIDDIRIYGTPIGANWYWRNMAWVYDTSSEDLRDPRIRICEELNKVFDSIFDFLKFTTENELDFTDGYLPTLDVKTKVLDNGKIDYSFFMKPMKNNLVIQRGTALSRQIVFSSLRQEIVGRLINTYEATEMKVRLSLIEEMIQLMRNSGHEYSFIKSVVLQGVSKYEYMVWRSKLDPDHSKYMPLHRERSFKCQERILLKYLSPMLWYSDEKLKEPYRQGWRKRIRYKHSGQPVSHRNKERNSQEVKTSTTFFVPPSRDSLLYKLVVEKEEKLRKNSCWGVMILEASGTPILNKLTTKFPIIEGCPRGTLCTLCDNDGLKCGTKGVIYKATCLTCLERKEKEGREKEDDPNTQCPPPTYVGETSRPWRERIREHIDGMVNYRKNSVFVEHWMLEHGMDLICPKFKFELITTYPDPLRRQISEALHIIDLGTLNRKTEFNLNELCTFEAKENSLDIERRVKKELECRTKIKDDLTHFIAMMTRLNKLQKPVDQKQTKLTDNLLCYRFKRTVTDRNEIQTSESPTVPRKKLKTMETSTPTSRGGQYRETKVLDDSGLISPIIGGKNDSEGSIVNTSGLNPTDDGVNSVTTPSGNEGAPTETSGKLKAMQLTPPKVDSSSIEEKKVTYQTVCLEKVMEERGMLIRTTSLPDMQGIFNTNIFYGGMNKNQVENKTQMDLFGTWREKKSIRKCNSLGDLSLDINNWSNGDFESSSESYGNQHQPLTTEANGTNLEEALENLMVDHSNQTIPPVGTTVLSSEVVTTVTHNEEVTTVTHDEEDNTNTFNQETPTVVTTVGSPEVVTTVTPEEEDNTNTSNQETSALVTTVGSSEVVTTVRSPNVVTTVTLCGEDNTYVGSSKVITTVGSSKVVTTVTPCVKDNKNAPNQDSVNTIGSVQTPRMSAVFLGTHSNHELLNQTPRGRSQSVKRSLTVSPENEIDRPRKISVEERMMSPRPRSPSLSKPRRNTWCPNSKKTSRKHKQALRVMTDQKLITQLFKPCGNGGQVDRENDEIIMQGSPESQHE